MKKDQQNRDHQRAFKERQRAAGLRQVTVWVPEEKRVEVREYAAKLCQKD